MTRPLPASIKSIDEARRFAQQAAMRLDGPSLATFTTAISNPPTQAEVEAVVAKMNEVITTMNKVRGH